MPEETKNMTLTTTRSETKALSAPDLHPLLRERWSPRAFTAEPIDPRTLHALFEAARWAPSCYNEQPWRFVVATREQREDFTHVLDTLVDVNREWAHRAGALAIGLVRTTFALDGSPNPYAWYDLALAVGQLTVQAQAMDLAVPQMGGFSADAVRGWLALPDDVEPVVALAIGRTGDPDVLDEPLKAREVAPRERRPLRETVFGGRWGRAASFVA